MAMLLPLRRSSSGKQSPLAGLIVHQDQGSSTLLLTFTTTLGLLQLSPCMGDANADREWRDEPGQSRPN